MRVLFSSTWGHGHIFPMVPLARAFLALGHEVRWATSGDSSALVNEAGIAAIPAGMPATAIGALVTGTHAEMTGVRPEDRAGFVFPRMFGAAATPAMLADLLPIARAWQPQLLVHEHAELAAPLVGALLGIPAVTHAFGGAIPVAIVDDAADRLASLWAEHGLSIPEHAGCFVGPYLDICPRAVQTVSMDHIPVVQPLRPVSYTGGPSSVKPGVLPSPGGRLVYVTLGTVRGQSQNQVAVLRAAIESLRSFDVRILVTVGPGGDPGALGPQPPHVTVARYVSQTEVLPRANAVVSHAGSGTVLGALAGGLPQLCLPQAADQFRNSRGVTTAGAGLSLHPDEATPYAIGVSLRGILHDESFRRAAVGIADDIRAMPSPDLVAAELARLT